MKNLRFLQIMLVLAWPFMSCSPSFNRQWHHVLLVSYAKTRTYLLNWLKHAHCFIKKPCHIKRWYTLKNIVSNSKTWRCYIFDEGSWTLPLISFHNTFFALREAIQQKTHRGEVANEKLVFQCTPSCDVIQSGARLQQRKKNVIPASENFVTDHRIFSHCKISVYHKTCTLPPRERTIYAIFRYTQSGDATLFCEKWESNFKSILVPNMCFCVPKFGNFISLWSEGLAKILCAREHDRPPPSTSTHITCCIQGLTTQYQTLTCTMLSPRYVRYGHSFVSCINVTLNICRTGGLCGEGCVITFGFERMGEVVDSKAIHNIINGQSLALRTIKYHHTWILNRERTTTTYHEDTLATYARYTARYRRAGSISRKAIV